MANTTIMGNAVVITSSLKLDDIKNAAKYRRKSLVLKGGDDGKEQVFAIAVAKGDNPGSIDSNGAVFSRADANGNATITFIEDGDPATVKERILDKLTGALINLNKLEEQLAGAVGDIAADKEAVSASISVIGAPVAQG